MVRWLDERQVNIKSQSELDIGGRETCQLLNFHVCLEIKLVLFAK